MTRREPARRRRPRGWGACTGLIALLAATLPAGRTRAAGPAAPCALAVTAEPARLGAGAPRLVTVRVAPAADAAAAPRLGASEGRLEPRTGGQGWTWRAPEAGVPRVAILGAVGGDGACGFAAVALDGVGDAEVRTRPGAVVEVRIAERTFGPARADATGLALVPVEVPAGVDAVFHGARRISLPLPPVAGAALFLSAAEAPADREGTVTGLLVAVRPDGSPAEGPPPLAAEAGALEPLEAVGPGAWRLRWRLPPGPAGEVALTAQRPGEPAVRAALLRTAGPPASARITLDGARATAGQSAPVVASVTLADAAGNAAEGDPQAEAEVGALGPAERLGPGAWRFRWTVPGRLEGRGSALLTVRAGAASAQASLELSPAGPAHLSLSPAGGAVIADGTAEVELVATVSDGHGNPVNEPPAVRTAQAGEVGPPRQVGPGRFAMTYRPRPASAPGEAEVAVALPPLSARTRLRLRPPIGPVGVSAGLGAALGPGGRLGLQAGAEATAWRWLGDQEAGLGLGAAFTWLGGEGTVAGGLGPVPFTGEVRTLALFLSGAWRRAAGQRLALRASAGAGAARVESLVGAGGGPLVPEAGWAPAATGAAAAGLRLGSGRAFLEARFTWLPDPGLASLRGAPSTLSLSLGYELDAS